MTSTSVGFSFTVNLVVNQGWVAEAMRRLWSSNRCWNLFSKPRSRASKIPQALLQHVEGGEEVAHIGGGLPLQGVERHSRWCHDLLVLSENLDVLLGKGSPPPHGLSHDDVVDGLELVIHRQDFQ